LFVFEKVNYCTFPLLGLSQNFQVGAFFAKIITFRVISLFVALLGLRQIFVGKGNIFP